MGLTVPYGGELKTPKDIALIMLEQWKKFHGRSEGIQLKAQILSGKHKTDLGWVQAQIEYDTRDRPEDFVEVSGEFTEAVNEEFQSIFLEWFESESKANASRSLSSGDVSRSCTFNNDGSLEGHRV